MEIVNLQPQLAALTLARICPIVSLQERPQECKSFLVYASEQVFDPKVTPIEWTMEANNEMVYGNIPTFDRLPKGAIIGYVKTYGDALKDPSIWSKGLDGVLCRVSDACFFDRPIHFPEYALRYLRFDDFEDETSTHEIRFPNRPWASDELLQVPVNPTLFEQLSVLGVLTLDLYGLLKELVLDDKGELRDLKRLIITSGSRDKLVEFRGEITTDLNQQGEAILYPSVSDPSGFDIRRRLRLKL